MAGADYAHCDSDPCLKPTGSTKVFYDADTDIPPGTVIMHGECAARDRAAVESLRTQLAEAQRVAETCTCQAWPPEGPAPDCAVHGAIRAFNEAQAALAEVRRERDEARATVETARWLVGDLVRADNNRCGSAEDGRITGADTLPLQQLLGLSLTMRDMFEGVERRDKLAAAEADRDRMKPVVEAANAWRAYAPDPGDWRIPEQPDSVIRALVVAVDSYRNPTPKDA